MASPQIPIQGVSSDYRVPGTYAEIDVAQGPSSASAGVREVVLVMPMLSTGTWTAGQLYAIRNSGVAEVGGGAGSPIHRAARKFISVNPDAKLWALPVAETVGGSPAAATATFTFATVPTAVGTAIATICGEDSSYTFQPGDTVASIATGMAASINASTWLPVIASSTGSTGVVTLTAKLKGISQGTASLGVIRFRVKVTVGVGTTVSASGAFLGSVVAGAEGSTTEATNFGTALANISSVRKYFIVSSANDSTSWGLLKTHVVNKSLPRSGLRSIGIVAYTGSLTNCETLAVGLNYERFDIALQPNSEHDTAELAAALAAVRQAGEEVDSATNFDGVNLSPNILPAFSTADYPDTDDQNDAILDGITMIASSAAGAYIVMSVDTRSKNSTGTIEDFRATETHRISVCDEFTDELLNLVALQYSGKKLKDDQRLADGSINRNQKLIRGVLAPSQLRAPIANQMDEFDLLGKLQNVEQTKKSILVLKGSGGRLESAFDLNVIDLAHQFTFRISEISQG